MGISWFGEMTDTLDNAALAGACYAGLIVSWLTALFYGAVVMLVCLPYCLKVREQVLKQKGKMTVHETAKEETV